MLFLVSIKRSFPGEREGGSDSCGFLWPEERRLSVPFSLPDKMMDIAKTRGERASDEQHERQHVALKTTLWKCGQNNDGERDEKVSKFSYLKVF